MTFGEWALLGLSLLVAVGLLLAAWRRVQRARLRRMAQDESRIAYIREHNPGFFRPGGVHTDLGIRLEYARLLFEECEEQDRLSRLKARAGR